jgi:hypothetical protein
MGAALDIEVGARVGDAANLGDAVKHTCTASMKPADQSADKRASARRAVALPARLTWKDQRGATRFASVLARNVSELGVYVECMSPVSIPLYRLVQFQLERDGRDSDGLPRSLRHGRVLSAVYRVSPKSKSMPQGLALRLLVEARSTAMPAAMEQTRATA